jgi:hypothetical protein
MARLNVHIVPQGYVHQLGVQPTLEEKIKKAQGTDDNLMKIRKHTGENKAPDFRVDDQGTLWYKNRICVPEDGDFRQTIMVRHTTRHIPSTWDPLRCMWI